VTAAFSVFALGDVRNLKKKKKLDELEERSDPQDQKSAVSTRSGYKNPYFWIKSRIFAQI